MSIDYGRLTAKDSREIRRAADGMRDRLAAMHGQPARWIWIENDTWEDLFWPEEELAIDHSDLTKVADILESLLMTDRRFR